MSIQICQFIFGAWVSQTGTVYQEKCKSSPWSEAKNLPPQKQNVANFLCNKGEDIQKFASTSHPSSSEDRLKT